VRKTLSFQVELDPTEALRAVFRRHASGVSVITMNDSEGNPVGFTATSMTSLGAKPPLASFNVASGASSWRALNTAEFVAIHTLGEANLALAKKMAAAHELRFVDSDWSRGPQNLPIFQDVSAVLITKVREIHSVESNAVVIVEIQEGLVGHESDALIYHQRAYKATGTTLE
jgi:flavin reductase (DIM6/NTAB) family NADH-FMN oxidoreductase RutF